MSNSVAPGWPSLTCSDGDLITHTKRLSCTLPAFLAVIGTSIASGSVLAGVGRFFGFGVGMAAVLVTLTLALAFLKQGLVKWLRRAVPYVQLASAILIVLAGAYVISYWLLSGNGGIVSR
jgi:cytochrome c-type biogenesis protein